MFFVPLPTTWRAFTLIPRRLWPTKPIHRGRTSAVSSVSVRPRFKTGERRPRTPSCLVPRAWSSCRRL